MVILLRVKLLSNFNKLSSFLINFNSKMSTKVAVCQFTATNDKFRNFEIVSKLINEANTQKAKMVFLPEACDFIGNDKTEAKNLAEPLDGPLLNNYRNLAKSLKIWISIGGFHELINNNEKIFNSHILIDDSGEIQAIYRKIHLFNVSIPEKNFILNESETSEAGSRIIKPINTPIGLLSLSICYDLRFPELAILQRNQGCTILTYPSAFMHNTGKSHWETLLRARAIETQSYVIAAAQYGRHNNKRISYGQSLIIDPWGAIIAECPKYVEGTESDESVAIAEINPEFVEKVRLEMPVFKHRRNDIYQVSAIEKEKFDIKDDEIYMFADKVIPGSTVFYKSKYSFAFTNIRCVVPGHVLISSLRHVPRLDNLTPEEIADLFQTAVKVQKVIEKVKSANASTVCVQDGKSAGQTVPHVHVHILPRIAGDFQRNDDIYTHLANHDRDENAGPVRSDKEMSDEAQVLRKYFI